MLRKPWRKLSRSLLEPSRPAGSGRGAGRTRLCLEPLEARCLLAVRITPAGTVTAFAAVISADANPYTITAGPDGNLWFTEYIGNRIGRITPTGTVTEFPIPTTNSQPVGITGGPDGNVWFTEFHGQ